MMSPWKPLIRIGLFIFILALGTLVTLVVGEIESLARTDLNNAPVRAIKDMEAWEKLETLPDYPVSMAVAATDPQLIYAGSASSGAYRSTNGGRTWTNIAAGLGLVPGAALRVTALAVDDAGAQYVAAATAYGIGKQLHGAGIYESKNGGDSWMQLGETDELVSELVFSDGTIHAVTAKGLVRYGTPAKTPGLPFGLDSLTHLSGLQLLMLTLTTGLGSLALVTQKKWG